MTLFLQEQDDGPERFSGDWWVDILLDRPAQLIGLVVAALIVRYLIHKVIKRVVARTVESKPPDQVLGSTTAARVVFGSAGAYSERRSLRVQTLGSLTKSTVTFVIGVIVIVMALDILGYPIGPLLASAGIAGVALGFGAQNLVQDFLAGIAMLLEDQYGVGDYIDMGEGAGMVEAVSLRVTRLRAIDGTVWYVRNGSVSRVGNSSQDWARAVVDVDVAYHSDTASVRRLLEEISHNLAHEELWSELVLEEPEVWGVETLGNDSIVIRVVIKTQPMEQWKVARELRERIKRRFDHEGIEIPFPQRTLWIKQENEASAAVPAGPAVSPDPDPAVAGPGADLDRESTADTPEEQRRKVKRPPEPELEDDSEGTGDVEGDA
ncbi:mechanosensitive ion channel family protein [Actinobacteria bacterium YIM 96077]|uniref:Mechanosensitive ion channel family protein n=1 Tax=Phytoactinopolyspora halophila TaxID=1981511 RepID=A0A329QPX6_9ACTN|nr:mechanosensitive ion channel family protein [Phytoactinopolyspora halophila]AYY12304.1 mechanosensitive ion channel family protein [Actinobacteria bacterium YIM 96077]RAW13779.1 mechanosensitive ion channel family protein [Phytoactinopolyspora halophila]